MIIFSKGEEPFTHHIVEAFSMEPIEVQVGYYVNKAGIYVEFVMECNTCELGEMCAWSKFLMGTIKKEFKELFEDYGMDFSTESAYLAHLGGKMQMIVCLIKSDYDEGLVRHLRERGIEKGEFAWK